MEIWLLLLFSEPDGGAAPAVFHLHGNLEFYNSSGVNWGAAVILRASHTSITSRFPPPSIQSVWG